MVMMRMRGNIRPPFLIAWTHPTGQGLKKRIGFPKVKNAIKRLTIWLLNCLTIWLTIWLLNCLKLHSFPKSNFGRLFIDLLIIWSFSDTSDTILDNIHSFDMFVVYLHREQHQKRRYSAESLFWLPSRQQRRHKTQCLASTSPPLPRPTPRIIYPTHVRHVKSKRKASNPRNLPWERETQIERLA